MGDVPTPDWMRGRYGADEMGRGLVLLSLVLFLLGIIPAINWLSWAGLAVLVWAVVRMFSRNLLARGRENARYLRLTSRARTWARRRADGVRQRRSERAQRDEYAFFTCPGCKQRVRVPRGKGTIRVICPRCKTEFRAKS